MSVPARKASSPSAPAKVSTPAIVFAVRDQPRTLKPRRSSAAAAFLPMTPSPMIPTVDLARRRRHRGSLQRCSRCCAAIGGPEPQMIEHLPDDIFRHAPRQVGIDDAHDRHVGEARQARRYGRRPRRARRSREARAAGRASPAAASRRARSARRRARSRGRRRRRRGRWRGSSGREASARSRLRPGLRIPSRRGDEERSPDFMREPSLDAIRARRRRARPSARRRPPSARACSRSSGSRRSTGRNPLPPPCRRA